MPDVTTKPPACGLIVASTPRWTVGLLVSYDVVIDAPPLARSWGLVGRGGRDAWRHLARRGAQLVWLPD